MRPVPAQLANDPSHFLERQPRHRCSRAAAWRPADAGRRRCTAAGSSSRRSSRGRSAPPDAHATDRPWHPGPTSAPAACGAATNCCTNSASTAAGRWIDLVICAVRSSRFSVEPASGAQSSPATCRPAPPSAGSCAYRGRSDPRPSAMPTPGPTRVRRFDQPRIALIHEAGSQAIGDRPIGGAKQQRASVRGHRPAIERGDHGTVLEKSNRSGLQCAGIGEFGPG